METINPIWLVALTLIVALFPMIAGLATAYIKISVVLGMLRNALGAQQVPSAIVVMGLSLAITMYVMSPVISETAGIAKGIDFSFLNSSPKLESFDALTPLLKPWKDFMTKHAGKREIMALQQMDVLDNKETNREARTTEGDDLLTSPKEEEHGLRVLIPAFVLSELKEAFAMGFALLLPFLVIDLIVANILVGLGMFMVSPVMIALPLKIILFVLADGWILLTRGLVYSYFV